jgi:ATP-binding cassette subfamily B protein
MATPTHPPRRSNSVPADPQGVTVRGFFGVFRYSRRALELVWTTNRHLTFALAALTLVAGVLPASVAYIGSLIVDAVVNAIRGTSVAGRVVDLVVIEGLLVASIAAAQRGLSVCQSLLRAQLGQRVNVLILEKALTLDLQHFEDSEFYDKLTRARREASTRPLSLVTRTFGLVQNGISLVSYGCCSRVFRRGR